MSNESSENRPPRSRGPRRSGGSDQKPRQGQGRGRQGGGGGGQGGGGGGGQQRGGRLSREEIEWARDLFTHNEPPDEIAQQLGVDIEIIEQLIAGWTR